MSSPPKARFSTGVHPITGGPKFKWERPIPINSFWNSFSYTSARNFLDCFTDEEAEAMKLREKYGDESSDKKAKILTDNLKDKLDSGGSTPLHIADNKAWVKIKLSMISIYSENGQLNEQIEACEEMIEKREDKNNLSQQHTLAGLLNQRGKEGDYAKAEELGRPCTKWLDEKVGEDSPQSMSSKRIIVEALWMQGRFEEAETLLDEVNHIITGMNGGKYGVYQEMERKLTAEMIDELKKSKPKLNL